MTTTQKDLLALEKKFWTGDSKFYRQNVDDSYVDDALPATVVLAVFSITCVHMSGL